MTDEYLESLITQLNQNQRDDVAFFKPICKSVDFIWIYLKKPNVPAPFDYYFIKNDLSKYVALVSDRKTDLHWYVLPAFRKQGFLTKAMKETILGCLFKDRDEQRITISKHAIGSENFIASEKVAISLGFIKLDNNYEPLYILDKKKYLSSINRKQVLIA